MVFYCLFAIIKGQKTAKNKAFIKFYGQRQRTKEGQKRWIL